MKEFLAGIDIGTTAVKLVLFTLDGHTAGTGSVEYPLKTPAPDIVEAAPEDYLTAVRQAFQQALNEAGSGKIAAVGITGQAETLICTDASGRPLRPAIVWLDNRAREEALELERCFGTDALCELSGQTGMLPCWPAAKILWLKRHEPEVFRRTAKFLMVEDFVLHALTGAWTTCRGMLPSTLYYDFRSGNYFQPMLDMLEITAGQLPELRHPGEIGGLSDGLLLPGTAGVPVSCGPLDHICGSLGAGGGRDGIATETTGTSLAVCCAAPAAVCDPERRIGVYHGFTPHSYVLLPWAPAAGLVLRCWRDNFYPGRDYRELDAAAEKIAPGACGLVMLPHWCGAVSPDLNDRARGAVIGITPAHRPEHFHLAAMESVAFLLRDNGEALSAFGAGIGEWRSLGGGARSPLWCRIKADVLKSPVAVPESTECTSLGAAMLAGIGAGIYSSAAAAQRECCRPGASYEPGPRTEVYEELFQRYRRLNRLLLAEF